MASFLLKFLICLHIYSSTPITRITNSDLACPPLSDCHFLPDGNLAWSNLLLSKHYRDVLQEKRSLRFHDNRLWEIGRENNVLHNIWEEAATATNNCYADHMRRRALRSLKGLIGDEAYYSGRLPPPIPYWYFTEK